MTDGRPTVFVTGGGSGIGMGLAAAFHAQGATVVIAGRTRAKLDAVAARHPGMEVEVLDVTDAAAVTECARRIGDRHPGLDTAVNNAGVQNLIDFAAGPTVAADAIGHEIDVNLKGLIVVTAAFLPLLRARPSARLTHIGSGLGFVPLAAAPVYSATKTAVHSFTVSLRHQLRGGTVQVVEIIPPVVETDLHAAQARRPPRAMSLAAFTTAAVAGIAAGRDEIPVGLARVLRVGARTSPKLFLGIVNKDRT